MSTASMLCFTCPVTRNTARHKSTKRTVRIEILIPIFMWPNVLLLDRIFIIEVVIM